MGTIASTSSLEDVRMTQDLPAGSRLPAAVQGAASWTRPLAFFERNRVLTARQRVSVAAAGIADEHGAGSPA